MGAKRSLSRLIRSSRRRGLLSHHRTPRTSSGRGSPGLTSREEEIANLAARGYTTVEIARELTISAGTVRKHIEHINSKLGIRRKTDLLRLMQE